jgi:hypothetical protein
MVLVVAASGFVLAACGSNNPDATSTTTTAATTGPTTTTSASGSHPTTPTTLPFSIAQVHTGTGPATLSEFSVPSQATEWDIDWVFTCSSTTTKTGTFDVTVVGHGASANTTDAGVTQQGPGTAGLVKNYDTGKFNLKVATTCKWTVRVEVLT